MLPIEIYNASQTLANFVNVNFDFVLTGKSGSSTALRYPEVQIMAVAVVATKLLFPFDLLDRQVKSNTDLSVFTMDWNIWAEQLAIGNGSQSAGQQLPFHQSFDFNETNIMEATDARLDSYLDWYQENIANEDIRDRGKAGNDAELRRALFTMFPLHREVPKSLAHTPNHDRNTPETQLGAVQSKMRLRQTEDTAEESYAIGSRYRRYRSANELSGVPELFFERAASLAGLSIEEMVQAVFAVERKLQKYEERLRKQAVGT